MITLAIAGRALVGAIAIASLAGCASSGANGAAASGRSASTQSSRYVLTATELEGAQADNLYDAIQKLRPDYLRGDQTGVVGQTDATGARVSGSLGGQSNVTLVHDAVVPVSVYRNGVRLGGLDDLRHITIDEVKEVRFLKAADAIIRLGTENGAGAIVVTTKQ
ncbi:MAG TPA: hypothetical protein VHB25_15820 [Gemmatimonadaceae bacterium]|nr:hypothetical protein [Gemmatimonadaceae bacterium]